MGFGGLRPSGPPGVFAAAQPKGWFLTESWGGDFSLPCARGGGAERRRGGLRRYEFKKMLDFRRYVSMTTPQSPYSAHHAPRAGYTRQIYDLLSLAGCADLKVTAPLAQGSLQ